MTVETRMLAKGYGPYLLHTPFHYTLLISYWTNYVDFQIFTKLL